MRSHRYSASSAYGSDSAFNKAFKAEFGVPPGEYRRDRSGS
jgi:AraC-like DNA-binding protein